MIFGGWGCSIFKKLHARSQDFSCMDGWGEGRGERGGVCVLAMKLLEALEQNLRKLRLP